MKRGATMDSVMATHFGEQIVGEGAGKNFYREIVYDEKDISISCISLFKELIVTHNVIVE